MAYTPPIYPGQIPTINELFYYTDDISWMYVSSWDAIRKELNAVCAELGTDPAGEYATVKERLDAAGEGEKNLINIIINAFRIAINGSLTIFKVLDGIIDAFFNEAGVDAGLSQNEVYNAEGDFYSSPGGFPDTMKLYLQCNGIDESEDFPDISPSEHVVTANNGAQVDTAIKKFGTGSLYCPINASHLVIPDSPDFHFGAGEMTIRFQIYFLVVANKWLFCQYDGVTDGSQEMFYEDGWWNFISWNGAAWDIWCRINFVPNAEQWYHVEITRKGADWYWFIEGDSKEIIKDMGDWGNALTDQAGDLWWNKSLGEGIVGHYDEIEIHKKQLHNANFSPPTGESTAGVGNITLISASQEAEAQPDTVTLVALEEDINAITLNVDLKAWASRDDGANYVQGTLSDKGDFDGDKRILYAECDVSGQAADKTMRWKFTGYNGKDQKFHAVGMRWD